MDPSPPHPILSKAIPVAQGGQLFSEHYSKNAYQRIGYKAVILQNPIEHVLDVNVPFILQSSKHELLNKKKKQQQQQQL